MVLVLVYAYRVCTSCGCSSKEWLIVCVKGHSWAVLNCLTRLVPVRYTPVQSVAFLGIYDPNMVTVTSDDIRICPYLSYMFFTPQFHPWYPKQLFVSHKNDYFTENVFFCPFLAVRAFASLDNRHTSSPFNTNESKV